MLKINYNSPSERWMLEHGVPVEQIVAQREQIQNFAARSEEERLAHSRAQIARMKQRFESKKIDFSKMRWDARRARFVPVDVTSAPVVRAPPNTAERLPEREPAEAGAEDWSRVTKDTAEHIARLNGIWRDSYEKLRGTGRIVMTVCNVLKGKAKRGEEIKWD